MLKSGTRIGGIARAGEVVAPLARQRRLGAADLGGPAEQVDRRLVEAEVVHRAGDLAVLDEVDAVAGQPGEQQRLRVDLADVPEAGQQQSALGARRSSPPGGGPAAVQDQVVDERTRRLRRSRVAQERVRTRLVSVPVAHPVDRRRPAAPLSKTDCRPPPDSADDLERRALQARARPGRSAASAAASASRSPIAGAAAGRGEDAAALLGVAGRRCSSTRRSSGRRRRSAAAASRTAPAGRSIRRARPAQPLLEVRRRSRRRRRR